MSNLVTHIFEGYSNRRYDLEKKRIEDFIDQFFRFIFFLDYHRCSSELEIKDRIESFKTEFEFLLTSVSDKSTNPKMLTKELFSEFPQIYSKLELDARSALQSDPAAKSIEEVYYAYPGFYAVAIYRFAHALLRKGVELLPRIWTEFAHSKTGIDIHPGAEIGSHFFIDHGTGAVIGETTVIGNHVKIYQGVTLGALSVEKYPEQIKRHPTIEDQVTIYANATILGGETVIGKGSVVGGNVWLTESIEPYSMVYHKSQKVVKSSATNEEPVYFII